MYMYMYMYIYKRIIGTRFKSRPAGSLGRASTSSSRLQAPELRTIELPSTTIYIREGCRIYIYVQEASQVRRLSDMIFPAAGGSGPWLRFNSAMIPALWQGAEQHVKERRPSIGEPPRHRTMGPRRGFQAEASGSSEARLRLAAVVKIRRRRRHRYHVSSA